MSTLRVLPIGILALSLQWTSALAQERETDAREAFREVLGNRAVMEARAQVKEQVERATTVYEQQTIPQLTYVPYTQRYGHRGRRCRIIWMPQWTYKTRTVPRFRVASLDWSQVDLATREYATNFVTLNGLPPSAGARSELIKSIIEKIFVQPYRSSANGNAVFLTNYDFPAQADPDGYTRAYGVVIYIQGNQSQIVDIHVGTAIRRGAIDIADTKLLTESANHILSSIVSLIKGDGTSQK